MKKSGDDAELSQSAKLRADPHFSGGRIVYEGAACVETLFGRGQDVVVAWNAVNSLRAATPECADSAAGARSGDSEFTISESNSAEGGRVLSGPDMWGGSVDPASVSQSVAALRALEGEFEVPAATIAPTVFALDLADASRIAAARTAAASLLPPGTELYLGGGKVIDKIADDPGSLDRIVTPIIAIGAVTNVELSAQSLTVIVPRLDDAQTVAATVGREFAAVPALTRVVIRQTRTSPADDSPGDFELAAAPANLGGVVAKGLTVDAFQPLQLDDSNGKTLEIRCTQSAVSGIAEVPALVAAIRPLLATGEVVRITDRSSKNGAFEDLTAGPTIAPEWNSDLGDALKQAWNSTG